ncbi:phage/plasmid primase, P4 family [Methanoculleus sp.]|uniref:DNA primase family protein n=1 Tax=Methanoculleus sp. TaxID=90427 RepID=UPI001BD4421C|nr:phage/plasmid primase, P4 family [Methanoculleus sp.]
MFENKIIIDNSMSTLFTHLSTVYLNADIVQNSDKISIGDMVTLSEAIEQYRKHSPTLDFIEVDDNNKKHPIFDAIEEHVAKTLAIVTFNGVPYVYDWNSMKYRPDNNNIERFIINLLKSKGYTRKKGIHSLVAEILFRLIKSTSVSEYPFNHCKEFIPVRNGTLHIESRELFEHSPVFGFTYCITPSYKHDADPTTVLDYLKSLTHAGSVDLLIQMHAQALIHEPMKKAYILYNRSGGNGKSTFLEFSTIFFGQENVSHVSMQDLCKGGFRLAEIDGKIANIYGDLPGNYIPDIGLFKTLTGDDTITVERKYQDPYSLRNRALLVFGCNKLPEIGENSSPFYERLYLIEFPNQFKVKIGFLEELTTEENLSAMLNLCLDSIDILLEQGLIKDKNVDETREVWQNQSDSCYRFISANLEFDDEISDDMESIEIYNHILPFEDTYQLYLTDCMAANEGPTSKRKFRGKLNENGFNTKRIGSRGEQIEYIVAARLKRATSGSQPSGIRVSQELEEISAN